MPFSLIDRLWPAFGWLAGLMLASLLLLDKTNNLLSLLIVGLAMLAMYIHRPRLDSELRWLIFVLLSSLLLAVIQLTLDRADSLVIKQPLRLLLMVPIFLAVSQRGLPIRFIFASLAIGMIVAALVAGWQFHMQGVSRPGIHHNPQLFGEVAMSSFAMLLVACLMLRDRLLPLYIVGLFAAMYSVGLSGSRGALIAIAPMLVFLLWWGWHNGKIKQLRLIHFTLALFGILLTAAIVLFASGQFEKRLKLGLSQANSYFEMGYSRNSIGLRLEAWRGAWLAGREYPFLGVGERSLQPFFKKKVADGLLQKDILIVKHAHNDYLEALQRRGFPGLFIQLLIYGLPLLIFTRALSGRGEGLIAALGGSLVTISYVTYSLTDEPMHNSLTSVFYVLVIAILIGIVKFSRNQSAPNSLEQ